MAKFANKGGAHRGRKYIKLKGDEVPTPEGLKAGEEFAAWFKDNANKLNIYWELKDTEALAEAYIKVWEAVALKGTIVKEFRWYFLRTYHTIIAARRIKEQDEDAPEVETLANPEETDEETRAEMQKLAADIMEYVRANYYESEALLFEICAELADGRPQDNYSAVIKAFSLPYWHYRVRLELIRLDVSEKFAQRLRSVARG